MLDGISLCISCPYQYEINDQDDDGNPIITRRIQNRLYRIADYSGGMFSLIDTHFSSLTTSFNPMYLREKRGSEQDLFKPVIMDWQFVQKRDDAEKGTTESFIDDSVTFYELIKIPDLIEIGDDTIIAKKLITGIPLPEHTANNFLIVISEDDLCYVVISCNQKNFRKMGNLYKIAGKIDDPLHAIHSLPSFVIRKSDIISTTNYKYLYSDPEAKVNIKPRFFYKYSYLPEIDGKLNLFTLSDYIPVQINKYLKFKSNSYDFTNAQKKAIISLIKEALELSDDFSDYLANGGYDKSTLQKELDFKTSEIISIISESDEFGSVINKVLKNDEQFKKQFIEEAKRIWLQEADEDRKSEEEKYQQIKNKEEMALEDLQVLSDKIEKQKVVKDQLIEEIENIRTQKQALTEEAKTIVDNLNSSISHVLTYGNLYEALFKDRKPDSSSITNITVVPTDKYETPPDVKIVDDIEKAKFVLTKNMSSAGIDSYYSSIIANIFITNNLKNKSIIIDGLYARNISKAVSYSLDGCEPTIISVYSSGLYKNIHDIVSSANNRVILIENLLDLYDEVTFLSLCKDFANKTLIFSIDNIKCLSLISKNIWNYALLFNISMAVHENGSDKPFIKSRIPETLTQFNEPIDTYEFNESLDSLYGCSLTQKEVSSIAKILGICGNNHIDHSRYIQEVFAFLKSIYSNEIDEMWFEDIKSQFSENILTFYHW